MKRSRMLVAFPLLVVLSLVAVLAVRGVFASGGVSFVKLDPSPIFIAVPPASVLEDFVSPLPAGQVTFLSNIDFDFPKTSFVLVSDTSVSLTGLSVDDAEAVHFLINSFGTLLTAVSPGTQIGTITLSFDDGDTEVTPLVVGSNIRQWRQVGDCGATINTITDPDAAVEFMGTAPNFCASGSGLAVIDRLTIPVEDSDILTAITVTDTQTGDPGIFFWAITVEQD